MNDLLVWIIDEEWSDYEVEKELIKKLLPDAKIRHSGYDYKKDLEEFGYQADLILAQVYTKIDKEVIDRLEKCRGIAVYGGGYDRIDILALPARGGRFYDWENNGMPDAIAQLLNEGKVQLFCADAMDGEGLLNGDLPQRRRAELQEKYFVYLTAELAPRILTLNNAKKGTRIWTAGVDLGAYHAVHCRLRRPTLLSVLGNTC